jgi:hypothetical protein
MKEDDEYVIKKFLTGLFSGFHLVLASQGIPLNGLIGETYTVENKKNESIMFAEVKNDNPLKIVYNIRWKRRTIMIDGNVDLNWNFLESKDEFIINNIGYNTLKLKNGSGYKLYTFNLPLKVTYKGIVDSINKIPERQMTVDSFCYIKGEEASGLTVFNQKSNSYLYDKFFGYLTKPILNLNDTMINGHSFVTVIFHNSGINLEHLENSEELQIFLNSKTIKLEHVLKKVDKIVEQSDRYVQLKHTDFIRGKNPVVHILPEEKKEEIDIRSDIRPNNNFESFFLSSPKRENKSPQRLMKSILFAKLMGVNPKDAHKKKSILGVSTDSPNKTKWKTEINKNPKRKHQRIFLKLISFMNKTIKNSTFANHFSPSFVRKILCGSWVNLNFFEINYNSNINNEMLPIFLKFDKEATRVHPSSRFNEKKGLRIVVDDFKFYAVFHRIFEKLWDPISKPLINDTRYREDLLWLIRYNKQIKNKSTDNDGRLKTFINSNKYKELLETYVYHNISLPLNKNKIK